MATKQSQQDTSMLYGGDYTNPAVNTKIRVLGPEIGSTGLNRWGGFVFEEFLPELQGVHGIRLLREMRENDPVIGAILTAIDLIVRKTEWHIDAADDSNEAGRAKELVESSLYDMAFTFKDTLSEILSMLPYGWSWFEICYKKREQDGLIGWDKWAVRGQDSLVKWEFDQFGGILGMTQRTLPQYKMVTIPMVKSMHFRTSTARNNPHGRSILRNAFRPWWFKKRMEEIEGIGIERDLAGIPVISPPDGLDLWNPKDPESVSKRAQAEKTVRSLRRNQHEGIVLPFGWKLELLTSGGTRQFDLNKTLERLDKTIALTALAQFLLLGTGSSGKGSYALASSQSQIFSMAISAYLDIVGDQINLNAIPKLMALNGIARELSPKVKHGDIESVDLQELGAYINALAGSGMPIFPTEDGELERRLLTIAGLPVAQEKSAIGPNATRLRVPKGQVSTEEPGLEGDVNVEGK